jgi:beta-glucanase (GH16 family)
LDEEAMAKRSHGHTALVKFALEFGAVEIRAKVPQASGAWPAFWALPANGSWPPEVDVMEIYGNAPNVLDMTFHGGTAHDQRESRSKTKLRAPAVFADAFHVFGCDISREAITWYLDGVAQWTFKNKGELSRLTPLYLVCNLAIGGPAGNPSGKVWPQHYVVDYIRAWVSANGPLVVS